LDVKHLHPRIFVVAVIALIAMIAQSIESTACSPNRRYFKLSLEQRVSRETHIFIGRVLTVVDGKVTLAVDEPLRGPKALTYEVRQGQGAGCRKRFTEGQKVFFAGAVSFGPSAEFTGALPDELVPIVRKLREKQPLEPLPAGFPD
jgi:hypothetical protein